MICLFDMDFLAFSPSPSFTTLMCCHTPLRSDVWFLEAATTDQHSTSLVASYIQNSNRMTIRNLGQMEDENTILGPKERFDFGSSVEKAMYLLPEPPPPKVSQNSGGDNTYPTPWWYQSYQGCGSM